jgi:hypothetical protein
VRVVLCGGCLWWVEMGWDGKCVACESYGLDVVCALSISEAHEYITYRSGSQMQDITRTNGYRSLLGFVALSFSQVLPNACLPA